MGILSVILQIILGIGFLMFGFMKFGSKQMVDEFQRYGYPTGFRLFTGLVEVVSALLVIAGIWNQTLATFGGLLMIVTMLGAIITHIKVKDSVKSMMMPIILLVLALVVFLLNV